MPKAVIAYHPDAKQLYRLLKRYEGSVLAVVIVFKDGNGKRLGPVIREFKNKLGVEAHTNVFMIIKSR